LPLEWGYDYTAVRTENGDDSAMTVRLGLVGKRVAQVDHH